MLQGYAVLTEVKIDLRIVGQGFLPAYQEIAGLLQVTGVHERSPSKLGGFQVNLCQKIDITEHIIQIIALFGRNQVGDIAFKMIPNLEQSGITVELSG